MSWILNLNFGFTSGINPNYVVKHEKLFKTDIHIKAAGSRVSDENFNDIILDRWIYLTEDAPDFIF